MDILCVGFQLLLFVMTAKGFQNHNGEHIAKYETVKIHIHDPNHQTNLTEKVQYSEGEYSRTLNVEFHAYGRFFQLKLEKHDDFHPNKVKYLSVHSNGSISKMENFEDCYYYGNIVGEKYSFISITMCDGLSGLVIESTGKSFVIEPLHKGLYDEHILYRPEDIATNETYSCGNGNKEEILINENYLQNEFFVLKRERRSMFVKTYIELVLVSDKALAQTNGGKEGARKRLLQILVNAKGVYKTINSDVVLIGLIAFENNPFTVTSAASVTLGEFSSYFNSQVRNNEKYGKLDPDCAHLISGIRFDKNQVGLADVGSVCYKNRAAGVVSDKGRSTVQVANTLAHEMGHNLGFVHVSHRDCDDCVMRDIASSKAVTYFASLNSVDRWSKKLNAGQFRCLWEKPKKVYEPRCGDGIRQKNEQCDCGSTAECELSGEDACCDMKTCTLKSSAECSDGPCCSNCKFANPGFLCRGPFDDTCEVNEYCTGNSSECPSNSFVQNGTPCGIGNSKICVDGSCVTRRRYTSTSDCKIKCQNGGVCNNHGNCHCPPGYACPDCALMGMGGSLNSGQGCLDPSVCVDGCLSLAVKIVIIVLCTLPFIVFVAFIIFKNRKTMTVEWMAFYTDVKSAWKNHNINSGRSRPANAYRNPEVGFRQPNKLQAKNVNKVVVNENRHTTAQQQPKAPPHHTTAHAQKQPAKGDQQMKVKPGKLKQQIEAYNKMDAKAAGKK